MRTEQEAEMDGFKQGLDLQIDFRFWTNLLVGVLIFITAFILGLAI